MSRRKLTFAKPGGHAKSGSIVTAAGIAYVARRDTTTSPPGDDWQPAVVETEAFSFAGPPGRDGQDGKPGRDGRDAPQGEPGKSFNWLGDWQVQRKYQSLDCVHHDGSAWVAVREAQAKEPSEASTYWDLLTARGERGLRGERGERGGGGERGRTGAAGASAATDLELIFDETARAGQVVELSYPNHCRVANGLSFYRCSRILGLAVGDTLAGSTGKVRTVGLLKLRDWSDAVGCESLRPRGYYTFHNYGKLTANGQPENTAIKWGIGTAISEDTLLVMPSGHTYIDGVSTITAPCLSTLPKGAPVYLATQTQVDAADMVGYAKWQVAGVLIDDVAEGEDATYKSYVKITKDDWSDVLESADTLLVADTKYYLADTPGKLTTDSEDRLFIGMAETTKRLAVHVGDDTPDYPLSV